MDFQDEDNFMFGQSNFMRDLRDDIGIRESRSRNLARSSGTSSVHPTSSTTRNLTRRSGESMLEYFQRVHNQDCRIVSFNEPSRCQIQGGVICAAPHCYDQRCPNNSEAFPRLKELMTNFKDSAAGQSIQRQKFESYKALQRPEGSLG